MQSNLYAHAFDMLLRMHTPEYECMCLRAADMHACNRSGEKRRVSAAKAETFCRQFGTSEMPYFETSAKTAANVHVAFEEIARRAMMQEKKQEQVYVLPGRLSGNCCKKQRGSNCKNGAVAAAETARQQLAQQLQCCCLCCSTSYRAVADTDDSSSARHTYLWGL
ncbi:UNVERIFIED_CONTAM: hypothetical protein H355_008314 [Colinus virginianus]|nr:hypothetical protein H355_008314 [Colinus virginianus]